MSRQRLHIPHEDLLFIHRTNPERLVMFLVQHGKRHCYLRDLHTGLLLTSNGHQVGTREEALIFTVQQAWSRVRQVAPEAAITLEMIGPSVNL